MAYDTAAMKPSLGMRTRELQRDEPGNTFTYKWGPEMQRSNAGYDADLIVSTLPDISMALLSLYLRCPPAIQSPNYCPSFPVASATMPWPSPLDSEDGSVACVWLGTRIANASREGLPLLSVSTDIDRITLVVWDLSGCEHHEGAQEAGLWNFLFHRSEGA